MPVRQPSDSGSLVAPGLCLDVRYALIGRREFESLSFRAFEPIGFNPQRVLHLINQASRTPDRDISRRR